MKSIFQIDEQRKRMTGTRHAKRAYGIYLKYLANIAKYNGINWPPRANNWQTIVLLASGNSPRYIGNFTPEMIAERDRQYPREIYVK